MRIDGFTLLLIGAVFCGLVWLVDVFYLSKKRNATGDRSRGLVTDISITMFPVLVVVMLVQEFVVEMYRIPSESMKPNLEVNDYIVVTKYDFGFAVPGRQERILAGNSVPQFGDVLVFRHPNNSGNDPEAGIPYIKRLIGVPGDDIEVYQHGMVLLNGVLVEDPSVRNSDDVPATINKNDKPLKSFSLKDNEFFVLGDNRDNSLDSRVWGTVAANEILGKAVMVAVHCQGLLCLGGFDRERVGMEIR